MCAREEEVEKKETKCKKRENSERERERAHKWGFNGLVGHEDASRDDDSPGIRPSAIVKPTYHSANKFIT